MSKKKKVKETNSLWPFYSLVAASARRFGVIILGLMVVVSGIIVAYQTHQFRQATIAYQQLQDKQTELDIQWQKLRLEQSALSEPSRIEELAEEKLLMQHTVNDDEIIMKPALRDRRARSKTVDKER